ncbi:hypothetical protein [Spiroplasma endosymbiont of Virgichneumon dumeticola]|uniref:hypothetical protein n=1 Tax=Spiroplasma endosymbiont of Virgichneumon dumeticola TaxID=3139323 RepID=UPI0035C8FF34
MFKLLSMLSVLAVSSSAGIGIVANTTHDVNANVQTLKQDVKLTDKVYGGISPLGIQSEPVASTLLKSL